MLCLGAFRAIILLICLHELRNNGAGQGVTAMIGLGPDSRDKTGGLEIDGEDDREVPTLGLLVHKKICNLHLVESLDIVIEYNIHNVGYEMAKNVVLNESSMSAEEFHFIGEHLVNLGHIPAGQSVTHVLVVKPRISGYAGRFNSAVVTYTWGSGSMVQKMYSNELNGGHISSIRDYNRKHSSHMISWIAFLCMCIPSLLLPFMLWYNSKEKYEAIEAGSRIRMGRSKPQKHD